MLGGGRLADTAEDDRAIAWKRRGWRGQGPGDDAHDIYAMAP
jgi:hypothetical protein